MRSEHPEEFTETTQRERRDALGWIVLVVAGLAVSAVAVHADARLGSASAPFLGKYQVRLSIGSLAAPSVATCVIVLVRTGIAERQPWWKIQLFGYLGSLAWALSLALVDGLSGLTNALGSPEEYAGDVQRIGSHPFEYVRHFTAGSAYESFATRGHPPGPVMLLWLLGRIGVTNQAALGFLVTALACLTVPLVLSAVKDSSGEAAGRRYAPVLVLAPYAVWVAVSLDAIVALLGAAALVAGVRASRRRMRGWPSLGWALLAGALIGVAALFSYAAPWLGLSVVFLYFARRRPLLNVLTGAGALVVVLLAQLAGFTWTDGLLVAETDYLVRIEPYRSRLWWSVLSVIALLIAAGPAIYASARKLRNTPAWPFLVGAGSAVVFSIVAGLARGGVEHAWLPFFPWLTVAAVAPATQGGPTPARSPLLLVGLGAAAAIAIEAVLSTPW